LPALLRRSLRVCSLFNTTPSLAATIMNHFKMGSNTLSYNISGMGCSAGGRVVLSTGTHAVHHGVTVLFGGIKQLVVLL
jgi:hypothetical protein